MSQKPKPDPKGLALRQQGCLNPHPERVSDELFQTRECFDPRDLIQVKYKMLRRVETDSLPVKPIRCRLRLLPVLLLPGAGQLPTGRPAGANAPEAGPKRAHKLTAAVLTFIRQLRQEDPSLRWRLWFRASRIVMASRFILAASNALWRAVKKNRGERSTTPARGRRRSGGSLRTTAKGRAQSSHWRRLWDHHSAPPRNDRLDTDLRGHPGSSIGQRICPALGRN